MMVRWWSFLRTERHWRSWGGHRKGILRSTSGPSTAWKPHRSAAPKAPTALSSRLTVSWLAFFAPGALKKVSVTGGAAVAIAETALGYGGTWGPDDTIVYTPTTEAGLYRVPASGGTPVELTTLSEGEFSHRWPEFLPNGKAVLFAAGPQGINLWDEATIEAVVLETGERRVVHRGGTYPRYASSSHLIFALEATLFAMPFDADRIETTGEPSPVIEGVRVNPGGGALYAWADDGTLVYVPGAGAVIERKLVWVDREGNASPLTETLGDWETPRYSRDGQRLAVRKQDETGQQSWILELSRGTLTRLTFEEGLRPLWSPDGETVFFASTRAGSYNIFSKPADSSGPAEQLTTGTIFRVLASITSDGKTLVFRQGGDAGSPRLDIGMMRLEGEGEPEMLLDTSFDEHTPKLSPDDRWLAYVSNESGRDEVYVRPFPRGGKVQISTEGGKEPMWSRDGRELFYRNGEKMMAVAISAGSQLSPGRPTLLFEGPYDLKIGSGASNYDVARDGRFVMIHTEAGTTQVTLVQNWFEELKRLVPTN